MKKIFLDVSEFEAPLPLLKAIEALEKLKEDEVLIFKHRLFPCKLEEVLKKNNFFYKYEKKDNFHFFYISKRKEEISEF